MPKNKGRAINRTENMIVQGGRVGLMVFVVLAFCFGGLVWFAGDELETIEDKYFGYDRTEHIANIPCLGCMALNPLVSGNFTFDTRDGRPHPEFILDILKERPVFLHFRTDACPSCDRSEPFLEEFEEKYKDRMTFIHINLDHTDEIHIVGDTESNMSISTEEGLEVYRTYNKFDQEGVPMFAVMTQMEVHVEGGVDLKPLFKPYLGEILKDELYIYEQDIEYALDNYMQP